MLYLNHTTNHNISIIKNDIILNIFMLEMFKAILPLELWNIIYCYSDLDVLDKLINMNKQIYQELSSEKFWLQYIEYNNIKLIDKTVNYLTSQEWINEIYYVKYILKCIYRISNENIEHHFLLGKIRNDDLCIPLNNVDICKLKDDKITKILSHRCLNFLNNIEKYNGENIGEIEINIRYWMFAEEVNPQMIATLKFYRNNNLVTKVSTNDTEVQSFLYSLYKNIVPD